MSNNSFHNPLAILSVGGLGRETGHAAIVNLAYQYGGKWPHNVIFGELDATEDTGRQAHGLSGRLPVAPPRRHSRLMLPDVNLRAIGLAAESSEMQRSVAYRKLFEVIPPELLAVAPEDTGAIGAHQKPMLGTALWILNEEEIQEFVKDRLRELRNLAGRAILFG